MLIVKELTKYFSKGIWRKQYIKAVDSVSFSLEKGRTLGLVGESGSGKSTVGKLISGLLYPTGGKVFFQGVDIFSLPSTGRIQLRTKIQIIFQDPQAALNPRMSIGNLLTEPLKVHRLVPGRYLKDRVADLLAMVGLGHEFYHRYPFELSGGQNQRVVIARALSLQPELLVLDEPTSALDISVQAQILHLLRIMQEQMGLTYLFISHDLDVVQQISDHVAVMYNGEIVEQLAASSLFHARNSYTRSFVDAHIPLVSTDRVQPQKNKGLN
ncbi:MAG: ABC transporter ATP-binding protein [Firmicutes bacterium HGW-Firmicutes-8]|nr:MAG: ABC transporter ATP-binding protein [Firmicutes bacterium HGW-Firmicutes-8]